MKEPGLPAFTEAFHPKFHVHHNSITQKAAKTVRFLPSFVTFAITRPAFACGWRSVHTFTKPHDAQTGYRQYQEDER